MRRGTMVLSLAVALLAAACGAGDDGGADAGNDGDGPDAAGCEGVEIVAGTGAAGSGFATPDVGTTAGAPFTICFDNKDPGVPHNVVISTEHGGEEHFAGEVVTGPTVAAYEVEALDAGTYHFHCEVHPDTMTGTLEVA